ncbi:YqaJ viral recombinase family protein [Candidatus Borreliella tachyglossi]|uniref:YqaJ viral recombinase family protein n=1 Tax=Candidatus Borreliella tachyglossi TaxID=1964448 RepID=UPI0040414676
MQHALINKIGTSEVANLFVGGSDFSEYIKNKITNTQVETNISMQKGKILEPLMFELFAKEFENEIQQVYANKYKNGIDKYSYSRDINFEGLDGDYGMKDYPVTATIDGWLINKKDETQLLELKYSDNLQLLTACRAYKDTGVFLNNKYFFKYYIQVQMQLACTGLEVGNLYFLIGKDTINCVIKRDDKLIEKVLYFVSRIKDEIDNSIEIFKNSNDLDLAFNSICNSGYYKYLYEFDYVNEFMKFIPADDLDVGYHDVNQIEQDFEMMNELKNKINYEEKHGGIAGFKNKLKQLQDLFNTKYPILALTPYRCQNRIFVYDHRKHIKNRIEILESSTKGGFINS